MAERLLGKAGSAVCAAALVVLLLGSLAAYANVCGDTVSSVAGTIVPPSAEPSRGQTTAAVVLGLFLPLSLLATSPQSLHSVSMV